MHNHVYIYIYIYIYIYMSASAATGVYVEACTGNCVFYDNRSYENVIRASA